MEKIKTLIIDDEPKAIEVLERYCQQLEQIKLLSTFRDPVETIDYLKHHKVDLILLDINMPKINGLQLLEVLDKRPKIIFTTAYSEFALESYDYGAVDYLLKPITFSRFLKAINKVQKQLQPISDINISNLPTEEKTIFVKSGPQLHKIKVKDILYLEKDGNYLIYHTPGKKIMARQNMKDLFEILDSNDFVRIHKSYVISKDHIDIIEATQIKVGEKYLPIGRNYKDKIQELL